MNVVTDQQLLDEYTRRRSEAAFAELVQRHVNLVYSAALRMVCDVHLAQDVTQGVFVALAQNTRQLANHPVLSGWLHRTARNIAAQTIRSEVRRRAREQESVAMNQPLSDAFETSWEDLVPHLDAALDKLNDADREAILLRYFEKKSAPEIARIMGISEEAAQKRVSRAMERLRELFARRGVTVEAGALIVLISTEAVQAAPFGFATSVTTAVLGTTAVSTPTPIALTKTVAMNTLQKTLVATAVAVLAGTGLYEARQASHLREKIETVQRQQAPMAEQIVQLSHERDQATNQIAILRGANDRLNRNTSELLRLRAKVGALDDRLASAEKRLKDEAMPAPPHVAWRLREPRKVGEFQNVGNETPEAAAETVLWAVQSRTTNLINMVHLSPELVTKANEQGMTDVLTLQLAASKMAAVRSVAKDGQEQVWLDGGDTTTWNQQTKDGTNTYTGVIDFHLSGREKTEDPATEGHTDFLFAKIDGVWKLVLPGLSPEIR